MYPKIDRIFATRIISLTWDEVSVALSKGWIESSVAVDRAIQAILNGSDRIEELELAQLNDDDANEIASYVDAICSSSKVHTIDFETWVKIYVAWLYEMRADLDDPLQAVEEVYADFDYPEAISHLVRYMPTDGPPRDLNEDWRIFVNEQVYNSVVAPPR